jgi:hypothetical protein
MGGAPGPADGRRDRTAPSRIIEISTLAEPAGYRAHDLAQAKIM